MIHFVKSAYAKLNLIERDCNQIEEREFFNGNWKMKNWFPLPTGTLAKLTVLGFATLPILYAVTGCYRDETQNESVCRVTDTIFFNVFAGATFTTYRCIRNFVCLSNKTPEARPPHRGHYYRKSKSHF